MAKSFWISILLSERSHKKNVLCSARGYFNSSSSIDQLSRVLLCPTLLVVPYSPYTVSVPLLLFPVFALRNKQASHLQDFRHYWLYDLLLCLLRITQVMLDLMVHVPLSLDPIPNFCAEA
jgi:hypothetical protein